GGGRAREAAPPLSQGDLAAVGERRPWLSLAADQGPLAGEVLDRRGVPGQDHRRLLPAHLGIGNDDVATIPAPEDDPRTIERETQHFLATPQEHQFRHRTAPPYVRSHAISGLGGSPTTRTASAARTEARLPQVTRQLRVPA